jgi:sugar phosphate isomerase/epimerase
MLGIIQGRLTFSGNKLQCFPQNPYKEFSIASKLNYDFIELFAEKKINYNNPIWSKEGQQNYIKITKLNKMKPYSFCDDYFIGNSLAKKKTLSYVLKILKILHLLKIKKYVVPLYGKSFIKPKEEKRILNHLSAIAKACLKYKIELCIESNMSPKKFLEIKKKISSKNCFFVFDTGNRGILNRDFFLDILMFGNNIRHVHLKDKNLKKKNVIIGKGVVNFNKFFLYLKKIKYNGSFSIESQRGKDIFLQAQKNYDYFSKLINKYID